MTEVQEDMGERRSDHAMHAWEIWRQSYKQNLSEKKNKLFLDCIPLNYGSLLIGIEVVYPWEI